MAVYLDLVSTQKCSWHAAEWPCNRLILSMHQNRRAASTYQNHILQPACPWDPAHHRHTLAAPHSQPSNRPSCPARCQSWRGSRPRGYLCGHA
eukprot:1147153-Pelagomonas_calceolata.AAC.8